MDRSQRLHAGGLRGQALIHEQVSRLGASTIARLALPPAEAEDAQRALGLAFTDALHLCLVPCGTARPVAAVLALILVGIRKPILYAGLADDLADRDRVDGEQVDQDLLGADSAQVDHRDQDAIGVREQGFAVRSGGLQAPAAALLELALLLTGTGGVGPVALPARAKDERP